MTTRLRTVASRCRIIFAGILATFVAFAPGEVFANRSIVDLNGRTIEIPDRVARVATLGPVPVLNSILFPFKVQIVNGLPPNFSVARRWKYQAVFSPGISQRPVIQSGSLAPLKEELLALKPDVVFTMDLDDVHTLEPLGIPVVYVSWDKPEGITAVMDLLGRVLDQPDVARKYDAWFTGVEKRVEGRVSSLRPEQRPRVLFCDLRTLTQPHLIVDWWIGEAGGRSVTDDGRKTQSISFSEEQLLAWDPQILILSDPSQVRAAFGNPHLANVSAVKNHRVYATPIGAHLWAHRTVEEPLTLLWAAKLIHPELFGDVNLADEASRFYASILGASLSGSQVAEILSGSAAK